MFRHNAGRAEDRAAFLYVVSRELANLLIWKDPDKYLSLYKSLLAETSAYPSWKPEALQQKYNEIANRYPQYPDFDVIGVRPYVLYPSAKSFTDEKLAGHYSDIVRFVAVLIATDESWKRFHGLSQEELEHLTEYVQRIKDTKFKLRLQRAIQDYYVWCSAKPENEYQFDYGPVSVRYVRHFAESRYGVHFKDTNEYGLYGFFVHDETKPNGEPRITYSYYRSDPTFQEQGYLNDDHALFEYFGGKTERGYW